MIKELWLSFHARGGCYVPSSVPYRFSDQNDPGAIGKRGRYKGVPTPFGYSIIEVPDALPIEEKVSFLVREVSPIIAAVRAAGAEHAYVSAGYLWKDQCDLEFSKEEMAMLAALGCPLCISCYQDGEEKEGEQARPDNAG